MAADDEALVRVTLHALEDDDFRQAWETAVREAADRATAVVAGARMAGVMSGSVGFRWEDVELPDAPALDLELVQRAFTHAVMTETARRVDAMATPGAFG